MKRVTLVAVISAMFVLGAAAIFSEDRSAEQSGDAASGAKQQTDQDRWMAAKLTSAQQIFEHLTRGDFEQLAASARRMQVMNFLEQWRRENEFKQRSEYEGQLNAFEFATKELVRYANDRNVDGALAAYLAMSESCVRCHKLIRDVPSE